LKLSGQEDNKRCCRSSCDGGGSSGNIKEKTTKLSDQYRTVSFTPGYDEKDFPIFLTSR